MLLVSCDRQSAKSLKKTELTRFLWKQSCDMSLGMVIRILLRIGIISPELWGVSGQRVYPSKEACVEHLGSILAKYKARGRVTTAQIGKIYCKPTGKWVSNVNSQMKNIRSGRHGDISVYTKK